MWNYEDTYLHDWEVTDLFNRVKIEYILVYYLLVGPFITDLPE